MLDPGGRRAKLGHGERHGQSCWVLVATRPNWALGNGKVGGIAHHCCFLALGSWCVGVRTQRY